jgi:hypothetical protein
MSKEWLKEIYQHITYAVERRSIRITLVSLGVVVANLVTLIAIASSIGAKNAGQADDTFCLFYSYFNFSWRREVATPCN